MFGEGLACIFQTGSQSNLYSDIRRSISNIRLLQLLLLVDLSWMAYVSVVQLAARGPHPAQDHL
jgi:hypothetical protein